MEDFLIKFFPDIYEIDQVRAATGQNNNPYCKYVYCRVTAAVWDAVLEWGTQCTQIQCRLPTAPV